MAVFDDRSNKKEAVAFAPGGGAPYGTNPPGISK
jgi:hypothetical protein